MASNWPNYPTDVQGGDEPTHSPTKNQNSLLAAERGTQKTKRLETDSNGNLYVNVAEGDINVTVGEVEVKNDTGNPVPISGTVTVNEPVSVDDNGGSLTVDGSISVSNFPVSQAVTGPLTDTELRAAPVPISGTVSVTEPVSIDDNGGSLTIDGTVTVTATDLDIRNLNSAQDSVAVLQATHDNLNLNANIQVANADVANGNPVPVSDAGGSLTVDASNLDIRDLTHSSDSVKIGDGTDFLDINPGGTITTISPSEYSARNGRLYYISDGAPSIPLATEVPTLLIKNPSGSGKVVSLRKLYLASNENAGAVYDIRLYLDPTITLNGTAITPVNARQVGTVAPVSTSFFLPTIAVNGTFVCRFQFVQGNNQFPLDSFLLDENHNYLFTTQTNNAAFIATFLAFSEEAGI